MSISIVLILVASPFLQDGVDAGRTAYREGRYREAAEFFEKALDLERSFDFLAALAHCRVQLGEWDAAVAAFVEAASITEPDDAAFHEAFGVALHRAGEETAALARLRHAETLEPAGTAALAISRILSMRGEWRLSEHELLSYLASRPDDANALELLATVLANDGRPGEAAEVCRRLLYREPLNLGHWVFFGQCEAAAGRPASAMDALEVALRLGHRGNAAIRLLADLYLAEGLHAAAMTTYERLVGGADVADVDDLHRFSLALRGAGERGRARAALERAAERAPSRVVIALDLARIVEEAGDDADAHEAYVAASRLSGVGALALADFERRRGAPERAAEAYALALDHGERGALVHEELVRARLEAGDREAALDTLRAGMREHPFHEGLRSLLTELASVPEGR